MSTLSDRAPDRSSGPAGSEAPTSAGPARRRAAWGLYLGMFAVVLEGGALNLSLPALATDLRATGSGPEWVLNGYVTPLASCLLVAGIAGDRMGRRRFLVVSLLGFAVASGACALSTGLDALITFRVVQGLFAAGVTPMVFALIVGAYREAGQRGRVVNNVAIAGSLGLVSGPLLGGLMTDLLGWRFVFACMVPVALVAALCAGSLAESRGQSRSVPVDLVGQVLGTSALVLLVGALVEISERGAGSSVVQVLAVGGIAAAALFVAHERRARHPLIPLGLFRHADFATAVVCGYAFQYTAFGLQFMFALLLQTQWDLSAIKAAAALLPFSVTTILTTTVVNPRLVRRGRTFMLVSGMAITTLGATVCAFVAGPGSYGVLVVGNVLLGIGTSLYSPSLNQLASTSAGARAGLASGVYFTVRQMGMATAVAALGALALSRHPVAGCRIGATSAALLLLVGLGLVLRTQRRRWFGGSGGRDG